MTKTETLIAILKDQVVPALGCTEPGAVAYAVARAKELLDGQVDSMVVYVDKNVLKNGMGVGIPGTPERGLRLRPGSGHRQVREQAGGPEGRHPRVHRRGPQDRRQRLH